MICCIVFVTILLILIDCFCSFLEGNNPGEKLKSELQSLNSKGMQVQLELKGAANSSSKKASGGKGGAQKGGQTSRAAPKRKR